jgi:hypothetical protein
MRKRDIKVGMQVFHRRSGKNLGRVTSIGETLIHLDGECPIGTPAELATHGRDTPSDPTESDTA